MISQLYEIINNIQKETNYKMNNSKEGLKKELEKQKEEINNLKKEIEKINNINKFRELWEFDNSIIKNIKEINLIKSAIEQRLGKEIKYFKKLYIATRDGESAAIFHKLCDNLENTISLIKTGGNRRFGGFTTQTWNQVSSYTKTDKHAFVFSLDKLKIYPYTNNGRAIRCDNNYLPTFGVGNCDFRLYNNPITGKNLYTNQTSEDRSYNYYGDVNALSEDGNANCISTVEIEVYQAII